ncbi:unnamed protein product [Rotaria socialis]|uniref:MULE transposase domain-containing protein n=1 Tax=Rotaria socialis TaxID=392032 RepID=A0A818IGV9_9BILA|nr:unnamed protein product [Rotaria socialis]CAF3524324.1 unnamed protein product [Rotaria socialis]CAF4612995.1 unnamed protein product [Rotaria socialis]CAF4918673.1 unnamed protein product [Rotaria socialis]
MRFVITWVMKELFDRLRYQHVMCVCYQSGPIRRHIKDGSRPNQESARLDSQFYFKIKHDTEINKIIFMKNKNLAHNHPLDENIYKNYSFVRNKKLQENNEAYDLCKLLITAKTSTYNNRKLINDKFDINLTRKDINNFKQNFQFNLVGDKSDPELLKTWINQMLNDNSQNSVQIKINDKGSTFKVNIENYQLYICLVQNANLKGMPVSYCLMKLSDLSETQVVMIDKDLTNADISRHYFDKARTLLCVFHVLEYLKV